MATLLEIITTAANDSALVEVYDAVNGYWRMIAYFSSAAGGALGTAHLLGVLHKTT